MKRLLLNVLLCATLFVGCKDQVPGLDESEMLVVSTNNIEVDADANEVTVEVNSYLDYNVYCDAGWSWITPSAKSGSAGTKRITFAIAENLTISERSATITIGDSAATFSETISVLQAAGAPFIRSSVTEISADVERFTTKIDVDSNIDYTISSSEKWCHLGSTSGKSGKTTLDITIDANTDTLSRKATITLENKEHKITKTVSVSQGALNTLRVIWYTSSDGKIVNPNSTSAFDATIISNTYEDGCGVIMFDKEISSIGDSAFYSCSNLKSITIPNSVTWIGNNAFKECDGLTSITIPNSVTGIGSSAFCSCDGLTSITIPNSLTSIGNSAFFGCDGLTSITIPNSVTSIGNYAFYLCSGLTNITIGNSVTKIGDEAFYECRGLTSVTIPNSVTTIGNGAFYNCRGLTSITIPNSVTSIGYRAFYYCSALTSITIPNSVTSIGNEVFAYCDDLTSITIPNSVTSIGNSAFYYCDGLTSITIPNSVTLIADMAFSECSGLTSVTIGNGVTSIGDFAFSHCEGLTSITIPNSVTSIGNMAFYGCDVLTSVYCKATTPPTLDGSSVFDYNASGRKIYVPTASVRAYKSAMYWSEYASSIVDYDFEMGVTVQSNYEIWYTSSDGKIVNPYSTSAFDATIISNTYEEGCGYIIFDKPITWIGEVAFYDCDGLTSITIPNSVTSIGNSAFYKCRGLTSIIIPNSVTSIGYRAFYDCDGLTSITLPNSVTSIGDKAFYHCSYLKSITIPNSVTSIGNEAFEFCDGLTSITIPNSVTSIGGAAFAHCKALKEFKGKFASSDGRCLIVDDVLNSFAPSGLTTYTIPNSVTSIGDRAFYDCDGLTSITIPNSVTSIGYWAFDDCDGLTSITIPNSVTSIGYEAFRDCDGLTSVTIGKNVTSIGEKAFYDCDGLTSITIPNSVTSIGAYAFCLCSRLTTVYCKATTPPTLGGGGVFEYHGYYYDPDHKIYVPTASVSAYKSAMYWSNYEVIIVGYDFSE